MKNFLITLFLGGFGVHRFMKKQYLSGVIYLCTMGVFGIGWAVDTAIALVDVIKGKRPVETQNGADVREHSPTPKQPIKSFDTVIVGTFAKSSKYPDEKREDAIYRIKKNQKLELEFWRYKGDPAYYVCDYGTDVGCIRAGLAKILFEEYSDCEFEVTATEKTIDEKNDCMTYNIRLDIYTGQ